MWSDKIKDRYWWVDIKNRKDALLYELFKAEDEEEVDLFLLKLYLDDRTDLDFFTEMEQKQVEDALSILMRDTANHQQLLIEVIQELRLLAESDAQPAL